MINIKENTTLIGVSELRAGIEKILKKAQHGLVVIARRHKPTAVLMSSKEYEDLQRIVETAEDIVLGTIARSRHQNSSDADYIDIETLMDS